MNDAAADLVEKIYQDAWDRGYNKGFEDGHREALRELGDIAREEDK